MQEEENGENATDSWNTSKGDSLDGYMKKAKPRPKWSIQEASQRWTLKGVFHFFRSASVGVPKIFAVFSIFLSQLWCSSWLFLKVNQEDLCNCCEVRLRFTSLASFDRHSPLHVLP